VTASAGPAGASGASDEHEAITYDPAFLFVEGAEGETVHATLTVKNQTRTDAHFEVEVLDMQEGRGNSRALDYVPAGEAPRGAAEWIQAIRPAAFDIEAGEERAIPVTIEIPQDAGAGGHYAALVFTAKDPDAGSQVPIDLRTPVPVLLTVRGQFERDLRISLHPDGHWRWRGGTHTWIVDLRNEGDVHEVYGGRVRIDGLLSGARSRTMRPGILLPGEHRRVRMTFELRDAPDIVGANLRVERDPGDPIEDDASRVFVLPWWLLLVLIAAISIIAWRLRTRDRGVEPWDDDEDEGSWDPSAPAG
jgi:hypothetical protein